MRILTNWTSGEKKMAKSGDYETQSGKGTQLNLSLEN